MPSLFAGVAQAVKADKALIVLETNAANSNEIPACLRWFLRFLFSSHSCRKSYITSSQGIGVIHAAERVS